MDYEKLNNRLAHMFAYENDNFFVNINLKKEISDKLYDYQFLQVFNLMSAFRNNNIILDGSDTGTGKTYTAIALCKQLNLKPLIICPLITIPNWKRVCDIFKVMPLTIVNYDMIKTGKCYNNQNETINCKFIEIEEINGSNGKNIQVKWKLPHYSIIIFDEVHKCKNPKSQNGQLLLSTKEQYKVLMLSATLSDKPKSFHVFGYMLGFYKNIKQSKNWINGVLLDDKTHIGSKPELSAINKSIYPNKGSRMRIKELGSKFPMNQVSADAYFIDDDKRQLVNDAIQKINEYIDLNISDAPKIQNENQNETQDENQNNLENNQDIKIIECDKKIIKHNAKQLGQLMKSRQILEQVKISIMVDLAKEYIENGYGVVLFVNFNETIRQLSKLLKTKCIINGDQSGTERSNNISQFQNNTSNIIICNIAISEGMSLHDLHGVPRVSIISPSFSATQLVQVLGRISRAGAKTPALQRLIYCADTCEENICMNLKTKLEFLAKLNDNDLIKF